MDDAQAEEVMDPREPILEHLNGLYWEAHQGQSGMSPVQVAQRQPTREAIQTLQSAYDQNTAQLAIDALLAERTTVLTNPSGSVSATNPWFVFGLGILSGAAAVWLYRKYPTWLGLAVFIPFLPP